MESSSLIQNVERKLAELNEQNTEDPKNQNTDSGCESLTVNSKSTGELDSKNNENSTESNDTENNVNPIKTDVEIDDIVIFRRDPVTNRSVINKPAYVRLHRSLSPHQNSTTILKGKYESPGSTRRSDTKIETLETLKTKYSPASFGYPRISSNSSQAPTPKPRTSTKVHGAPPGRYSRYSFPSNRKQKDKDENSNEIFRKNSSSSGEFITIVTRSESEGSIDKLEKELDLFMMEGKPKEKKRSNSFKRIFSGKIFSKDKKKTGEEQNKLPCKENVVYSDNIKNETNAFNRQSSYRHTVSGNSSVPKQPQLYRNDSQRSTQQPNYRMKEIDQQYAQMHVNEFQHIKRNFETQNRYPNEQYVHMNRPVIANNPGPMSYSKMPNIGKFIDSSSSASTLDSERDNIYQNEGVGNSNRPYFLPRDSEARNIGALNMRASRFSENIRDNNRETPPRAQELRQNVRLVNPKALIPINSERPLPNPYQQEKPKISPKPNVPYPEKVNNNFSDSYILNQKTPRLEETYGTVFDTVELRNKLSLQRNSSFRSNSTSLENQKIPRSPSLESTKLKLPINREIVPLSPRVRSPIPPDRVSTEKLIATELLKPTRSPTPTRTNLSSLSDKDQTDYNKSSVITKPPIARLSRKSSEDFLDNEASGNISTSPVIDRIRPTPSLEVQERIVTNAMVHVHSPIIRTPTPTGQLPNRSSSPMRPQSVRSLTPVEMRSPSSSNSRSPQKDEIRKSVEAYYWKEIKKLKEQEEMYYYQMQMKPYGWTEEPITIRKSRSMSPSVPGHGRRSLSLPRDPRPSNTGMELYADKYGRVQPNSIPEGSILPNQQDIHYHNQAVQQNFLRNAPGRQTIDGVPRNYGNYNSTNSLYRPIFKRGSLTVPVRDIEDPQNKKVSFTGSQTQNPQVWPTRNGLAQNPPQRKSDLIAATNVSDDDVFLPSNNPHTSKLLVNGKEVYGYVNVPIKNYQPNTNEEYYVKQKINGQNVYGYSSLRPKQNNSPREPLYGPLVVANVRQNSQIPTNKESPYGPLVIANKRPNQNNVLPVPQKETLYGQPVDTVKPPYQIMRHNSVQLHEPIYRQKMPISRQASYDNNQVPPSGQQISNSNPGVHMQRREIIMTDEIFGTFGGYVQKGENIYYVNPSRQNNAESVYGYVRSGPRQITVRNKVCDIYGQIHDRDSPNVTPAHQQAGVVLGQLQKSSQTVGQSYSQLPNENFVRNSRLTASVNDMHRRYQNVDPRYRGNVDPRYHSEVVYQRQQRQNEEEAAPSRPLPPVPTNKKSPNADQTKTTTVNTTNKKQKPKKEKKKRSFFGK